MHLDEVNARFAAELSNLDFVQGKSFVYGEGKTIQPHLLLIGEAPGAQEELLGRPFVGKAGKNLDQFLSIINIVREEIYITNAVKMRPTKLSPYGTQSNRTPLLSEQESFKPWLLEEIKQINAKLIVTLGNVPLKILMGQAANIGSLHGKPGKTNDTRLIFPLYHPAAIIYNRSLIDIYEQDLNSLRAFISAI